MIRCILAVQIALVCVAGCADSRPRTIRVLSYNIRHGEGMDGRIDLQRVASVIRAAQADLVSLQEVDRGVERTAGEDQPSVLAKLTGMEAVFERNIHYQGGEYGNAILSRLPIVSHRNHHLPQSLPNEQRGALEVEVEVGTREIAFFATHLDYHRDDGERMASVERIREILEGRDAIPVIIAGDLNALPGSRVIREATSFLQDSFASDGDAGHTFPADRPTRRIDYVLYTRNRGLRCLEHRVLTEPQASDHRPLLAVFRLD